MSDGGRTSCNELHRYCATLPPGPVADFAAVERLLAACWDDSERRVIEIVIQHTDPDEQDKLLIHETCHAVVDGNHGKKWQDRMERAAKRADELDRDVLAKMLRQEIAEYQEATTSMEVAYNQIRVPA